MTINGLSSGTGSNSGARKSTLDQEAFLQLLTLQLASQDPYNAVDDKELFQQMATMTSVQGISEMRSATEMARAQAFIGHKIDYYDSSGRIQTGVVDRITFEGSNVSLSVNGGQIQSSDVYQDYGPPPASQGNQ